MTYEDLMQERPDGITPEVEQLEGFDIITPSEGEAGGMFAHRGVLTGDEHIDMDTFTAAVEEEFGYTLSEVAAVYKVGGMLTSTQREFRAYIDARMLALSSSGGNIPALAVALSLSEKTIDRALARARELHVEPQVKNPARRSTLVCFKCEEKGARPRKRRFSTSPEQWVGTVNLCDSCVTDGYEAEEEKRNHVSRLQARPPVTAADAAASRERIRELLAVGA